MSGTMANVASLVSHRYAIFVSYLGTRYNGSQRLRSRGEFGVDATIQEALETACEGFFPRKRCKLTAASRTDKGVHALRNCFTFPLMEANLPTEKLKLLANENLIKDKHDIVVNEALLVPRDFHARKSAMEREYIYRIAVAKDTRSASLLRNYSPHEMVHLLPVTELFRVLPVPWFDRERAAEVIELLQGEHDFASFAFKPTNPLDTVRTLEIKMKAVKPLEISPQMQPQFQIYQIHFRSRAFLHNQIRRIVGAIVSYATYQSVTFKDIQELLDKPSPLSWIGNLMVAEPWGLFLSDIVYDPKAFVGSIKTDESSREPSQQLLEPDDSD